MQTVVEQIWTPIWIFVIALKVDCGLFIHMYISTNTSIPSKFFIFCMLSYTEDTYKTPLPLMTNLLPSRQGILSSCACLNSSTCNMVHVDSIIVKFRYYDHLKLRHFIH